MIKKPLITIKEEEIISPGYMVFKISITVIKGRWLFWNTYTSGIAFFNQGGYFTRLINNLKDDGKICYLLFFRTLFSEPKEISKSINEDINKALLLSSFNQIVHQELPRKKGLGEIGGTEIRFLMIKEIQNIQKIVDYLFGSYSSLYFIFDTESNKDILYSKIKDFKELDERSIFLLSSEVIELDMECCSADEEFKIFTNRFDKNQIKAKILDSIEEDKLELR